MKIGAWLWPKVGEFLLCLWPMALVVIVGCVVFAIGRVHFNAW